MPSKTLLKNTAAVISTTRRVLLAYRVPLKRQSAVDRELLSS